MLEEEVAVAVDFFNRYGRRSPHCVAGCEVEPLAPPLPPEVNPVVLYPTKKQAHSGIGFMCMNLAPHRNLPFLCRAALLNATKDRGFIRFGAGDKS